MSYKLQSAHLCNERNRTSGIAMITFWRAANIIGEGAKCDPILSNDTWRIEPFQHQTRQNNIKRGLEEFTNTCCWHSVGLQHQALEDFLALVLKQEMAQRYDLSNSWKTIRILITIYIIYGIPRTIKSIYLAFSAKWFHIN